MREEDLLMSYEIDKAKGRHRIAEYIVKHYHVKTISEREREIFIYEDGIYKSGINVVRKFLQDFLSSECRKQTRDEILEKVRDLSPMERRDFFVPEELINLNNGVLNVKTRELFPHDPKYLFLTKIPVDYLPEADCPQIKKFFRAVLDKEAIPIIHEFCGYGFLRSYPIKKAIILVGEPNTGKTTLLRLIIRFFGEKNVSGVNLQKLASDKFAAAQLYTKYLNVFDDLSFKDINDTGTFKITTGGGYLTAEYKFGSQFMFENYAKLIFAANKIPDVKDVDDDAYFTRWIILRFNREIKKMNKSLINEMTTPQELSGFLNLALNGLQRLMKKQDFSYLKTFEEIKKEMMSSGSAVASFASECMTNEPNDWVSKDRLYGAFVNHARSKNMVVLSKGNFGMKIKKLAPYIESGKKKFVGHKKQITGWRNVGLTAPLQEEEFQFEACPLEDEADHTALNPQEESRDSTLFK